MSKEALAHEEAVQKAALAIADARGIAEADRTFGMMSVFRADADAVLRSTSHLPDREEVLQEAVKELRMVAALNAEQDPNFVDGIMHALSRILSLMERKA